MRVIVTFIPHSLFLLPRIGGTVAKDRLHTVRTVPLDATRR